MKVLFVVQGEGRGHLTQALALEEMLTKNGHQVVEVLVGRNSTRRLPGFFNRNIQAPVKRFLTPSYYYEEDEYQRKINKGLRYNLSLLPDYYQSMCYINRRIKASGADVVLNFHEMLTGLVYTLFRPETPYITIGHQYLFLHSDFNETTDNQFKQLMLKLYTRISSFRALKRLALSYTEYDEDSYENITVVPPLLRSEICAMLPEEGDYLQGYMVANSYARDVEAYHQNHPETAMHFFWDNLEANDVTHVDASLSYHQIDDVKFIDMMAKCKAYATTAGFESICEAMYLGKPVMMVPIQTEQHLNALDAQRAGAGIISDHFDMRRLNTFASDYVPNRNFVYWVRSSENIIISEIERLVNKHTLGELTPVSDYVTA